MPAHWNGPERCNVAGALAAQAAAQPRAAAVHYPGRVRAGRISYHSASYRELDALSDAYARGLIEYGIGRGVRAALMVPPGLDFVALFFALFKAGAVPVLIDPGIGLRALKACLAQCAPQAFIGVSRAQLARRLLRWAPDSIRKVVTVGARLGAGGIGHAELARMGQRGCGPVLAPTRPGEMAAILFTSGSTGLPKGVVYRHRHFARQVEMLKTHFGIRPGEVDLATFPPFALFDPALGMSTVIPKMDPTRPARARPEYLLQAIERFGVTSIFGSPALAGRLARHLAERGLRLPTVRRFISAGAAVPVDTVLSLRAALPAGGEVHTPYGATECLPVASLAGEDLDDETRRKSAAGAGVCVGRVLEPNRVGVIGVHDGARERLAVKDFLPAGHRGEIVVHGPTTTDAYWRREEATRLAKMSDDAGRVWHRMGDVGYLDVKGRLWYCGRKSQRVCLDGLTLLPDQAEAVFNAHPGMTRSALVGVGERPRQRPVLVVELPRQGRWSRQRRARLREELLALAAAHGELGEIRDLLFHGSFPVDIRHNAKIDRGALARWATGRLT